MGQLAKLGRSPRIGGYLYAHPQRLGYRRWRPTTPRQLESLIQGEKSPAHIPDSGDNLA